MRRTLVLLYVVALALVYPSNADNIATALTEVASVPFGASREDTVKTLGARTDIIMAPAEQQKASELTFGKGDFAGQKVAAWWFRFAGNKLYEVEIAFDTQTPFATLDEVATLLTTKYGEASTKERSYSFPYNIPFRTLDDAHIKAALNENKASFYSVWQLTNGRIACSISLNQGNNISVHLTYTQSELAKGRSAEIKSDL